MAMADAASVAAKWAQRTGAATQAYTDGINRVQVAPGQAAARQASVWAQNTAAAQSKYAKNSAAVSREEWQNASINKGAPRLASGVAAAQDKYQTKIAPVLSHIAAGRSSLPARGTLDQNLARMNQFVRHMANFKG